MEMGIVPLALCAAAALLMMFHGLGGVQVLEVEPAFVRIER